MLKNILVTAWRHIARSKLYSVLNIVGLAIGMACSILIMLWVRDELSYDRFHKNASQTYRVVCDLNDLKAALTPAGLMGAVKDQLPQIQTATRVSTPQTASFAAGNRVFEEKRVYYTDDNFLQVFSFRLVEGDPATALKQVNGVLITVEMAKKYFGGEDAIGKVLEKDDSLPVTVTGVVAGVTNSHLQFDFLMPMEALGRLDPRIGTNALDFFGVYSYLRLRGDAGATAAWRSAAEGRIDTIYARAMPGVNARFHLQPLTDIHLHSNFQADLPGMGNSVYVTTFSVVAVFILLIACINFMNLATARSARRAREVGVRKVIGATRGQLIAQFIGESLVTAFLSLLLAMGLVAMLLPTFNGLAGKMLIFPVAHGLFLPGLVGIALVTGLLAGLYPALYLSGFLPVIVLKKTLSRMGGHSLFRNGLVVLQFTVSILLLTGTIIVYEQLHYIRSRDIGFQKENLLYIPLKGNLEKEYTALRSRLAENPLTSECTAVSQLPSFIAGGRLNVDWPGKDPKINVVIPGLGVDEDFLRVLGMRLLAGRGFSRTYVADSNNYIVNEKALEVMGMKPSDAVGKTVSYNGVRGSIIGVVKDFNFKPVHQAIEPLFIYLNDGEGDLVIRTRANATDATIGALAAISKALNPGYPFTYGFVDQDLDRLYQSDSRLGRLLKLFAVLAIFVSCLGLYGLSAFMAEQRTKEIGLRKVLGATVPGIVYLMSMGFTRIVLLAIAIAIPVSWYAIHQWLDSFAYHVQLQWTVFAAASAAALLVTWITISYESIKVAFAPPAESLRTE